MGDFEGMTWAGGSGDASAVNSSNPSMKVPFALGILKTSSGKYELRVADLRTTSGLYTAYDGNSPKTWANLGGIILGIGGDNSNDSFGTFFEGAITSGRPSDNTDLAVFKNIQSVGYSK
jgi:non-reducing end alpha-L-arabinofuranosidase